MKMTTKQLRELDAWIAENVFGITGQNGIKISDSQAAIDRINNDTSFPDCISEDMAIGEAMPQFPRYTTDPAAAVEVLEKCRLYTEQLYHDEQHFSIRIDLESDGSVIYLLNQKYMECKHCERFYDIDELPQSICLFAKKLFTKQSTH